MASNIAEGLKDLLAGAAGGGLIGLVVSVLVNLSLSEIRENPFFALLFGLVLLSMGAIIFYRIYSTTMNHSAGNMNKPGDQGSGDWSRWLVMTFAVLVMLSGLSCFFLEKDWFTNFSGTVKTPMYALLGVALWFALSFTIMDLVNYTGALLFKGYRGMRGSAVSGGSVNVRPFISTSAQICLVLVSAILLGLYFGVMFGLNHVKHPTMPVTAINHVNHYSYTVPVGIIVCALVGAINQVFLRPVRVSEVYHPVYNDGI